MKTVTAKIVLKYIDNNYIELDKITNYFINLPIELVHHRDKLTILIYTLLTVDLFTLLGTLIAEQNNKGLLSVKMEMYEDTC